MAVVAGLVLAALVAAATVLAGPSSAAPPPKNNQLTIKASVNPVVAGKSVVISGNLKGSGNVGVGILLQQNPYPFAGFTDLASTVTTTNGAYTFTVAPKLNTRYRVSAIGASPANVSNELSEVVNKRVSLRVSDSTPAKGRKVYFSGTVSPAHDGTTLYFQRRTSTGSFRTVGKTTLRDAGDAKSTYRRSIRISSSGVYRAFVAADVDHGAGTSSTRSIRVH